MLKTFDDAIEQSVNKLINAKTGTEVRTFIVEFEELMFARTKLFTQMIMQEQRDEESKSNTLRQQKNSKLIEETLNSIRNAVYTGKDFDKKGGEKLMEKPAKAECAVATNHICTDRLTQKEVCRRTADALLKFIEKVTDEHNAISTHAEDIVALPEVARTLLEISKYLVP